MGGAWSGGGGRAPKSSAGCKSLPARSGHRLFRDRRVPSALWIQPWSCTHFTDEDIEAQQVTCPGKWLGQDFSPGLKKVKAHLPHITTAPPKGRRLRRLPGLALSVLPHCPGGADVLTGRKVRFFQGLGIPVHPVHCAPWIWSRPTPASFLTVPGAESQSSPKGLCSH